MLVKGVRLVCVDAACTVGIRSCLRREFLGGSLLRLAIWAFNLCPLKNMLLKMVINWWCLCGSSSLTNAIVVMVLRVAFWLKMIMCHFPICSGVVVNYSFRKLIDSIFNNNGYTNLLIIK